MSVWARLLGVERAIVEDAELEEASGSLIVRVRLQRRDRGRCGICRRRCPGYDAGDGRRRWRSLDLGTIKAFIEAEAPRVSCPEHGVVVAHVPWARHGAGHTRAFDDQLAWLAAHTSKSAVGLLMRVAWRTVGSIITRVVADGRARRDPLDGLARIGIDEISYRRGHRYLTVVVDHDTGRLVWAGEGRNEGTLDRFFDELGPERSRAIRQVSADGAEWIERVVHWRAPAAILCTDPFHVVAWATDALDALRREVWNAARKSGDRLLSREIKGARWALYRRPAELSERQSATLSRLVRLNAPLYRAYLLKEQLREVFALRGAEGIALLEAWVAWALRCGLPSFVEVARKIERNWDGIVAGLIHGLSNGLVESVNTKIRLLTRIAFGFRSTKALIALAMLGLGGYCPPLPGR
jgi:transposase